MSEEYKNKFYRTAHRNAIDRQLAAKLFRAYKSNPVEAYNILMELSKLSTYQDKKRLLKYLDKLHRKDNIISFVGFYMLHRVTLPNNPDLKRIYWQSNLSLLYPELPEKEARLKALRSIKNYHYEDKDSVDVQTPETIVETPTTTVQTPTNMFQAIVSHIKEKFEHLK